MVVSPPPHLQWLSPIIFSKDFYFRVHRFIIFSLFRIFCNFDPYLHVHISIPVSGYPICIPHMPSKALLVINLFKFGGWTSGQDHNIGAWGDHNDWQVFPLHQSVLTLSAGIVFVSRSLVQHDRRLYWQWANTRQASSFLGWVFNRAGMILSPTLSRIMKYSQRARFSKQCFITKIRFLLFG